MVSAVASSNPGGNDPGFPIVVPVESVPEPRLLDLLRGLPGAAARIWPAWSMLSICVLLSLSMIGALFVLAFREGFTTDIVVFLIWGPLFTVSVLTGMLILQKYPGHRVGWVLCLTGTTWVATNATYLYGTLGMTYPDWGLPAVASVLQAGSFYPFGLYLVLVELLLIFPTGSLASLGWGVARGLGLIGALGASLMIAFGNPLAMNGEFGEVSNPWHIPGMVGDVMNIAGVGFLVIFAMGIPAGVSMIRRLRQATGVERLQLRWIAWDTVILVIAYVCHLVAVTMFVNADWYWLAFSFWGLALNSLAVVVGIAILRFRLYDIDLVIHRSLLYGSLVALIAVIYVALVNMINLAAQRLDARDPNPWMASIIVAVTVTLLLQPLRSSLQHSLNHWLYGARDDPGDILTRLGVRLESAIAPADVLSDVTRIVMDLLRLPHAAIAMQTDTRLELVAEAGLPGLEQVGVPMIYQHERIGELRVTPRSPGERFSRADCAVLEGVARQTAVAAYAFRVSGDLQHARERLVTAREEERRRLRRDLHDGLGAQLAALTIQTGTIRRMVRSDPGRVEQELEQLQTELRSAITDIRRLVHGLRPPALDEFGLIAALRSRLIAFESSSGIAQARLLFTGREQPLPAAVEVAVYRIVEEALTNVSRHAGAHSVTVSLAICDDVRVQITDDGIGFPATYQPGVGIQSMRERTEELGGSFEIGAAADQGTRIAVSFPL